MAVLVELIHGASYQALLLSIVGALVLLLCIATIGRSTSTKHGTRRRLPPSPPGGLPVIGHLHLIGASPQVSLRDLARAHGSDGGFLMLRLGAVPSLVASSPRAAEAVLRTHDHQFASRPQSRATHIITYGSSDISLSPYGEPWRQRRKLVTAHLFTTKKIHSFRHGRQQEVRLVMDKIRAAAAESTGAGTVDVTETMNAYTNDVVCRAVSGKLFRAQDRNRAFKELLEENSVLFGGFNLEDYFPALARLRLLSGFALGAVEKVSKKWDELLETIIREHETKTTTTTTHGAGDDDGDEEEGSNFIDVLLSVQKEYGTTREQVKAILMNMFAAGTDTSSLVLDFAMAELMRHPQAMAKLQAEVRSCTPSGQEMVEEGDLAKMTYLKAIIKETLRLHPPTPLLIPHHSIADVVVDDYMIPAGSRVIVNAWAIARDPGIWERPEEFLPERFVDDSGVAAVAVDLWGNDFEFLPFRSGRRTCPGLKFGLATIEIMLANLVYCFDWEMPTGVKKEDIDMTEVFGLTVRRKEKLMLVPKPIHGAV